MQTRADAACLDVAAYVRKQTIGGPGPRTRRLITGDLAELARLRGELARIGNNLNQLTRLANIGDMERPEYLDRALDQLISLLNQVRDAMDGGKRG